MELELAGLEEGHDCRIAVRDNHELLQQAVGFFNETGRADVPPPSSHRE
jgi:hypothetical protein